MGKIELSQAIKDEHEKYFKETIYEKLKEKIATCNNDFLRWFYTYCDDEDRWKILAIGEYSELLEFQRELDRALVAQYPQYPTFKSMVSSKEGKVIRDDILSFFGYKKFTEIINDRKWSAYKFVCMAGVRVCPYCKRQYITPDISKSGRMRGDIDHFLAKSEYPHFSMSIYNWVLSCPLCNRSLKGARGFSDQAPSPYEYDYNEMYYFYADFGKLDCDDGCIRTVSVDPYIDEILDMFHIKDIYQVHSNVAKEFFQKSISYPPELIENLIGNTAINLYKNFSELRKVLLGYPCKENIDDEALGKLKSDLAIQAGLENELDLDGEKYNVD